MQIFTKSNRIWAAKKIDPEDAKSFKQAVKESGIQKIMVHTSYLINIGSNKPVIEKKSIDALTIELERCELLDIPYLVLHPGSHTGAGEEECIKRIAKNLDLVLATVKGESIICLEAMAGQGTNVGYTFEQLRQIIDLSKHNKRLGVCLDSCHVHAAGYDISTPEKYDSMMQEFSKVIGIRRLKAFHVNDSKLEAGAKRDRHAPLGKGTISLETFRAIMNDERLINIPKVLETPTDDEMKLWKTEIALLRKMVI